MVRFIIILFFISNTFAEMNFTPGGGLGNLTKSDAEIRGKNLTSSGSGLGFNVSFETGTFLGFSLITTLGYESYAVKAQYTYTNESNILYTNDENETSLTLLEARAGLNFYLVNARYFKVYGGGGVIAGSSALTHNLEDYKNQNNTTDGFKLNSGANYNGPYYEVGVAYLWNDKNGLIIKGNKSNISTGGFETLNGSEINTTRTFFSVNYIHVVDLSFFWK